MQDPEMQLAMLITQLGYATLNDLIGVTSSKYFIPAPAMYWRKIKGRSQPKRLGGPETDLSSVLLHFSKSIKMLAGN